MPVMVADFLQRFPAFEDAPQSYIEVQLGDAQSILDRASFANDAVYDRAVMLWAAHNLTLTGSGETVEASITKQGFALDAVQSVSDSGVSVSLRPNDGSSIYGSTSYGRELDKLLRMGMTRRGTVGGLRGLPYGR